MYVSLSLSRSMLDKFANSACHCITLDDGVALYFSPLLHAAELAV